MTEMNTCSSPGAVKLTMGFESSLSDPTQCLPLMLEYVYFEGARNPTHMLYCGIFAAVALSLLFLLLELEAYYTIQDSSNRKYWSQKYASASNAAAGHLQGMFANGPKQLGRVVIAAPSPSSSASYNLL